MPVMQKVRNRSQAGWFWALGITLGALLLRLYRSDHQSYWMDEAFSVWASSGSIAHLMEILVSDYVHPPLHYFMLHLLFRMEGVGSFEPRLLSVLMGTAAVPILYLAGKSLFGVRAGLIAALLLAVSQLGVEYSQEVRPYALQTLIVSSALLFFAKAIWERLEWAWWAFVVSSALAIYSHYYSAFFLVPLYAWALLHPRKIPLWRTILGLALAAMLFVPWLFTGVVQAALANPKTMGGMNLPLSTPFEYWNRFNNAVLPSILGPAPVATYFFGAILYASSALAAALAYRPRLMGWLDTPLLWMTGASAVAVLEVAIGGGPDALIVAGIFLVRAFQLFLSRARGASSRLTGEGAWIVLAFTVAAGLIFRSMSIAVWQFPSWSLFLLGMIAGGILMRKLQLKSDESDTLTAHAKAVTLLLCFTTILPIVVPLAMSALFSMPHHVRYAMAALPSYYLLVAHGLTLIERRNLRWIALACCVIYSVISLRAVFFVPYKTNWRDTLSVVAEGYREGDAVMVGIDANQWPDDWQASTLLAPIEY